MLEEKKPIGGGGGGVNKVEGQSRGIMFNMFTVQPFGYRINQHVRYAITLFWYHLLENLCI